MGLTTAVYSDEEIIHMIELVIMKKKTHPIISRLLCIFALLALCLTLPVACGSSAPSLTPPGGWQDSNDALHPDDSEAYYEWWYLDARFDNGYTCALTFFWRQRVEQYHIPLVMIDVYQPDGTQVSGAEPREQSECKASREKCDVVMGKDFLRQEGDDYKLSMRTKEASAELTFHRKVPPWKWSKDGLIVDDATGKQGWVNAIPRGDVEGKLWIGDEVVNVSGQGYHDHNWGNADLPASRAGWGWGRMYDEKFTYVYGWLMPKGGGDARPTLYLAMDDQVIFASNKLKCTLSDYKVDPKAGDSIPNHIVFEGKEGDVEVSCQLDVIKVLQDKVTDDNVTGFSTHYYRRLNKFKGTIIVGGKTHDVSSDDAINEYVKFVPLSGT